MDNNIFVNIVKIFNFCEFGNLEKLKIYVTEENINDKDIDGNTLLHIACNKKNIECLNFLLTFNNIDICVINNSKFTPLMYACIGGFTDVVKILLDHRDAHKIINISSYGYTPLYFSCMCNRIEITKLLLKFDNLNLNDTNKLKETSLYIASRYGNYEIVKLLLSHKNINIDF